MSRYTIVKVMFALIRSIQYQKAMHDNTEMFILMDELHKINDEYKIFTSQEIDQFINNPIKWPENNAT